MKQCRNYLLTLLTLILFLGLFIESLSVTIRGDQQDFPYQVNFQIQFQSTINIKAICLNESNLNWLLLKKQIQNIRSIFASNSDQNYSSYRQIANPILKGNYSLNLNAYAQGCNTWILEVNSHGINQQIYGCKFFDNVSGKCNQCEQSTPYLVNTTYIPQMTCARMLIQGCQKYSLQGDNCQKCSEELPYLVNFEIQNSNLQKRCVSAVIQMCRIYSEDGTQCARYSYETKNVVSSSPANQSENIMLASKQDFAILQSSQCPDPTLPNYAFVIPVPSSKNGYKCEPIMPKYIAFRTWSGGYLNHIWTPYYSSKFTFFYGVYTVYNDNTQDIYYSIYYQFSPSSSGYYYNLPQPDMMLMFGYSINLLIPNCQTYNSSYNSQNDHCLQCSSSYPYLVATDYMPFEACVSTKITGCYIYEGLYAQSCQLYCSYGDSNIVDTNVRPIKTCAPSLIANCEVYTLNGTYCICHNGQTVRAYLFIDPYSFYCVQSLLDSCLLYGLYGTSCLLCTSSKHLVPAQGNINICVNPLIIGCLVYTYNGLSCYTCCSGCSLVTTNYPPYLACLPQNTLIPQCQKYNLNNQCLQCPVKVRKLTCFGISMKCKVESNKLNQCSIKSA